MKKQLSLMMMGLMMLVAACSKDDGPNDGNGNNDSGYEEVSGDITSSMTWTADKIYLLKGTVYVTNNATLTIEPGTIIKGEKSSKGTLIISRGSKIMAEGTTEKPIVFTSQQAAGARREGDWGGLILLGKAPANQGDNLLIEGVEDAGDKSKYGGNDPNDNSGVLKYVRVEFAGIALAPDNEINGVTFGGVGSGTTVDYVQVYRSGDDSFEWFGGTVNAKHLLATYTWDDDFDTDFGYSGKIQFALAQRVNQVADVSRSNGFESDNNATGTNQTPQTSAVFSNVTILGPIGTGISGLNASFQHAVQIRRNSSISAFNSIFTGFPEGVYIDASTVETSDATTKNFLEGRLVFKNNLIYDCNSIGNEVKGTNKAAIEGKLRADNVFDSEGKATDLFADPYKFSSYFTKALSGTPNYVVKAGSAAASGAQFTDDKLNDPFFETVDYKGAFGTENWAEGWAHFSPETLPYEVPGAVK